MKKSLLSLLFFWASSAVGFSVVLDTGHTAKNYGAVSPFGKTEFSYNKNMVETLQRHINGQNIAVRLVPNNIPDLALRARTENVKPGDLFLSVHHDAFPAELNAQHETLSGFSVFVSKKNADFAKSFVCAQSIAERLIRAGEQRSRYHEADIDGERKTLLDERGVYQYDDLTVLKTAPSPAVLIEIGVIANPHEAKRLARPSVQTAIARAISQGVADCAKTF